MIRAIDVKSRVVDLGLNGDGTVQVPRSFHSVGWYAGGPAPGAAGGPPALFVGHVDSHKGPGVFFRLRELRKGDRITIRGIDAVTRQFTVYRLADYAKSEFPATRVYAPTRNAEVRLITCSGQFDRRERSYLGNLVVYAALTRPGA